jgi:Putative translation initiation inhibitor, yjgF family
MSTITRMQTRTRMSAINIHNGTVYLAGQIGSGDGGIKAQAALMLGKVDALLGEAGTDRAHMLAATIFLKDMQDFTAFNEVWDAWVPEGHAPARACVQASMNHPDVLCEVVVTAALP